MNETIVKWPADFEWKNIGTLLRDTTWQHEMGFIADETISGKLKVRAAHISKPTPFKVKMRMRLKDYKAFIKWFEKETRRGVVPFYYPEVNGISGELKVYRFAPESAIAVANIAIDILDIEMSWEEI
jgi:hypothetical protein